MLPQLPFDVLAHIFRSVPATRLDDEGARTLSCCLQVNHLFYDACIISSAWKTYYHCRYTLFEQKSEIIRRNVFGNDWRAMYAERRRIDQIALDHLQNMIFDREHRHDYAENLLQMSLDIWDTLDIERQLPIPPSFRIYASEPDGIVKGHALTRRYWANLMANVIVRCSALDVWRAVINGENPFGMQESCDSSVGALFELAMSAFSCFFGRPLAETTARLDQLADECRTFLAAEGTILDPSDLGYDLSKICRGICAYMDSQGFGIAEPRQYRQMLNHFPHSYLITSKRTLPISLVHIFVAISRRIGINASPVNFPGTVIVHVATQQPEAPSIIINPSAMDPAKWIVNVPLDIRAMTSNFPMRESSVLELLVPSNARTMLNRASHNILFAFQEDIAVDFDHWQPAMFAAISAQFLLQAELPFLRILVNNLIGLTTLDCSTFILNKLGPMVPQPHRQLLEQRCGPDMAEEAIVASTQHTRQVATVRYFVGMVTEHVQFGYMGCIIGWDFTCNASESWIRRMKVDELTRGRNQPFYRVVVDDGTSRYVAEENITHANPSLEIVHKLYSGITEFPSFFEDVELHRADRGWDRGRFLLSPDSLLAYPQDDEVGAVWVREGKLPY